MQLAAGTRLGPYEILSAIGAGGMGEVYKASDTRLGRAVAIKILAGEFSERFETEARAISAVNHPNICALYDIGMHQGNGYLVLEYLEGKPLEGPLATEQALRVAIQIAAALEAAHRKSVIHRDLKPANIFVAENGSVKLLDFGLAKLTDRATEITRTVAGTILGTAAYMAPEQAEGRPLDARSDIFSFGAVVYELVAGRRAFPGETVASVLGALLRDDPKPMGAGVPAGLESILMRCLKKRPEDRFQRMDQVRAALEALTTPSAQIPVQAAPNEASIAVLPFANLSADKENEYFSDGLAEEIINALTKVRGLKVTARTSAFAFRGENQDIRRIAETLNVRTILEGSVRRAGNRIRVVAELVNASDGYHIWSERYDAQITDVFAVQDEIAGAIAAALKLKLSPDQGARQRHLPSLPAYEALLMGRHYLFNATPEGMEKSLAYFEKAIALDPEYALPHALVGTYYWMQAMNGVRPAHQVMGPARVAALKALELDPELPDALSAIGVGAAAYEFDWTQSGRFFAQAMAGEAVPASVHYCYAFYYLLPLGRIEEAVRELDRAIEADPLNIGMRIGLINGLYAAGREDRAIAEARKALQSDPGRWNVHLAMARIYANRGQLREALEAAETAYRQASWNLRVTAVVAALRKLTGDPAGAEPLMAEMRGAVGESSSAPMALSVFHAMCGEIEPAADWLEKAIEQRDPAVVGYLRTPLLRGLRASPRWAALAKMMRLPVAD
jgi:eukaryotic-like serine/threonine-protein kinase